MLERHHITYVNLWDIHPDDLSDAKSSDLIEELHDFSFGDANHTLVEPSAIMAYLEYYIEEEPDYLDPDVHDYFVKVYNELSKIADDTLVNLEGCYW